MLTTPLPQTFGGSITVWKAQPGPEGPLDLCPAFFLWPGLQALPISPSLWYSHAERHRPACLTQPSASYSLGLECLLPLLWVTGAVLTQLWSWIQGPNFHPALGLCFFHEQHRPVSWSLHRPLAGELRTTACLPPTRGIPWVNSDELSGLSRLPEPKADLTRAQSSPTTSRRGISYVLNKNLSNESLPKPFLTTKAT